MTTKNEDEVHYPNREAAAFLGVSPRTTEGWRYKGAPEPGLPYYKMGRAVRYRLSDLRAFRDARRQMSTTEGA